VASTLTPVADDRGQRQSRFAPYLMSLPGLLCLYLFFIVPLVTLLKIALSVRVESGSTSVEFQWEWSNFSRAFTDFGEQLWRAFAYAGIATVLCILLAYPMAYFIAFKGGRWRNLLLGLVMVPFFTSFLLRTIAWQSLFADDGPILGILERLHLIGLTDAVNLTTDGRIMYTPPAVIGGLTYSFLPFALLPIYVSLEKVQTSLVDASSDLYASFGRTFRKVILPLSMPGVFAGTLLVFIPAAGDFINNELLGNAARQPVIGGVIQARFLDAGDLPTAAAISLVLMAIITVVVLIYAKFLGTEELV
jgi:spermidine/putrescine transport system permease protein